MINKYLSTLENSIFESIETQEVLLDKEHIRN